MTPSSCACLPQRLNLRPFFGGGARGERRGLRAADGFRKGFLAPLIEAFAGKLRSERRLGV